MVLMICTHGLDDSTQLQGHIIKRDQLVFCRSLTPRPPNKHTHHATAQLLPFTFSFHFQKQTIANRRVQHGGQRGWGWWGTAPNLCGTTFCCHVHSLPRMPTLSWALSHIKTHPAGHPGPHERTLPMTCPGQNPVWHSSQNDLQCEHN
jgi:hypothetical protein